MTCKHCAASERDPKHAIYTSGCQGCKARAMAHSPVFFDFARSGRLTKEYRDALASMGLTHDEVKKASARLKGQTSFSLT